VAGLREACRVALRGAAEQQLARSARDIPTWVQVEKSSWQLDSAREKPRKVLLPAAQEKARKGSAREKPRKVPLPAVQEKVRKGSARGGQEKQLTGAVGREPEKPTTRFDQGTQPAKRTANHAATAVMTLVRGEAAPAVVPAEAPRRREDRVQLAAAGARQRATPDRTTAAPEGWKHDRSISFEMQRKVACCS
jgi:hypothetical protein